MRILLTNDDGIRARGLSSLLRALSGAGHDVTVFAPPGASLSSRRSAGT